MAVIKKKRRFTVLSKADLIFYVLMAAIPVVQFAFFYIGVNFNMILMAFKTYDMDLGKYVYTGFNQFKAVFDLFQDNGVTMWLYTLNSLKTYALGLVITVPLALLFSYYIYKKSLGWSVFKVILFAPSIICPMVTTMVYQYMTEAFIPELVYSVTGKVIGGLMQMKGMTFWMLFIYTLWTGFGTNTLLYVGAMSNIDPSVTEAAKLDGVGRFSEFTRIVLPQIIPTFSVFLVTGVAGIFVNQMGIFNFFGRYASDPTASFITIGYWFFVQVAKASLSDYPMLSAFGLLISAVTIPAVFAVRKLLDKLDPMSDGV